MSKLTASFRDNAFNRLAKLVMSTRPERFKFVAPSLIPVVDGAGEPTGEFQELFLVCQPVSLGQNPDMRPRYTRRDHLPYFGVLQLPYCFQVTALELDFHPSDQIALPPELSPLEAQTFVARVEACFGLACPDLNTMPIQ